MKNSAIKTEKCALARHTYKFLIILLLLFSVKCWSQYVPYTQVTNDDPPQDFPAMYENYIVYEDLSGGGQPDIMLYNISTKTTKTITSSPDTASEKPDIYGNRIVWQDNRNGDWDIYMYNLDTPDVDPQPVFEWEGDQTEPSIYGDLLAFTDKKPGISSYNIWFYNFSTGVLQSITHDIDGNQRNPDVYKGRIVWQDQRMGNWDIYMYDTTSKEITALTDDPSDQVHPSIWGRKVVWEDYRQGNADIYMHIFNYGIGGPFEDYDWPVYVGDVHPYQDPNSQKFPQIYDNNLVFQDYRNGNWDIYLYKFYCLQWGNLYQVTSESEDQEYPAVYGDYVAWADKRRWDGMGSVESDIWMWEFPPGIELSVKTEDIPDPVKLGDEFTYNIYAVNNGYQDATDVVLTDNLPGGLTYISAYIVGGGPFTRVGNVMTFDLDTIKPGEADTIVITMAASETGKYTNLATIEANEDDVIPSNNSYSCKTEVLWNIPQPLGKGYYPDFVLDKNNKVHLCYISSNSNESLVYATNKTGLWKYDTIDKDVTRNSIEIDKSGNLHIVYAKRNASFESEFYYLADSGAGRSTPYNFYTTDPDAELSRLNLGISPNNIIYVAYLNGLWYSPIQICYRKEGTWHGPVTLTVNSYNDLTMAVDKNGYLHLAGYDITGMNPGPYYLTNAPDSSWKSQESIEPGWAGGQLESLNIELTLDENNVPHVSYSGRENDDYEENYKYANRVGGSWSQEYVDDEHFSRHCAIAVDKNGNAHLFYNQSKESEFRYATNTSGSWVHHVVDFGNAWDLFDIRVDPLLYKHFIYGIDAQLYYVTDAPPPAKPEITVSPKSLDFHSYVVGDTTESQKVVIGNNGDGELIFDTIYIGWPYADNFSITQNTCPEQLDPGDTCSVDMAFNPDLLGDKTALLFIKSNDPENSSEGVSLYGTGLQGLMVITGYQNFGNVVPGDSIIHDFTLKNKGNYRLHIQLAVIQTADAEDFILSGMPEVPFNVEDGDSVNFQVKFKPHDLGSKTSILKVYAVTTESTIPLSGSCAEATYTVSGNVFAGGNPVDEGWIWVITLNEDMSHHTYYYKPLEGSETFSFTEIPDDVITLQFDPDNTAFPGYLSTYLGDTPFSVNAESFALNKDTSGLVINLVAAPPGTEGSGEVSGNISDESGGSAIRKRKVIFKKSTENMDSIRVYLLDSGTDTIVAYDVTDADGNFKFDNLENGSYKFLADFMGYPMDASNELINITGDNRKFTIAAVVANNKISTQITQVNNNVSVNWQEPVVYPNPLHDKAIIELHNLCSGNITIQLIDAKGAIIWNKPYPSGAMLIEINTGNLEPGLYVIRILDGKQILRVKFIKAY